MFAYRTVDEARAGLEEVVRDYPRHARAARELALAHFAAEVVLPPLLERATAGCFRAGFETAPTSDPPEVKEKEKKVEDDGKKADKGK